jgi:hypothetical protein
MATGQHKRELVEAQKDPFALAALNDLGAFTAKHRVHITWWLASAATGFAVSSFGTGVGIWAMMNNVPGVPGDSVFATTFFAFTVAVALLCSTVMAIRKWNQAVYLFDRGFVSVPGAGGPVRVFRWADVVEVRKRVQVRVREHGDAHWITYIEAVTCLDENGQLVERKQDRLAPAHVGAITRIQYYVKRADGEQVAVTGAFRDAFGFGQTALAKACRG